METLAMLEINLPMVSQRKMNLTRRATGAPRSRDRASTGQGRTAEEGNGPRLTNQNDDTLPLDDSDHGDGHDVYDSRP